MTPRQIVFVTFVALGLLMIVLELIRRRLLRERYSLLWFFVSLVLLSLPWLYDLYVAFGHLVGIVDPESVFYYTAIMGLVLLSLQFSLALSSAHSQRKALIQQVALLENRLRHLENQAMASEKAPEGTGEGPSAPAANRTDASS